MTEYHTVYKGREETTQWDDIQRKLGNLAPKEKPFKPEAFTPDEHEAATSKRGEEWIATCDDPGELSDAEDEFQDDEFLEKFRWGPQSQSHTSRHKYDTQRIACSRVVMVTSFAGRHSSNL